MNHHNWVGSTVLVVVVLLLGIGLAAWKYESIRGEEVASANQPEPMESITVALARAIDHRQTTTSIGTVLALQSVTLAISGALVVSFLDLTTINIYSQVGLITLVGLIAKNGILIVEFANQLQARGYPRVMAVREAALTRLRPVLMTSAATVFGHLPLILASGPGAAARNSIGMVLVTGMTVGTLFTLFVVPVFYAMIAAQHRPLGSQSAAEGSEVRSTDIDGIEDVSDPTTYRHSPTSSAVLRKEIPVLNKALGNYSVLSLIVSLGLTGCAEVSYQRLNEPSRDIWQKPHGVIEKLSITPGSRVADLGAGGGYFTWHLAKAVGARGTVYAVDINPTALDMIFREMVSRGTPNVRPVRAKPHDPRFPEPVDLVFICNTYHQILDREAYFRFLASSLRPGGRIAILDFHPRGLFSSLFGNRITREDVRLEMEAAGYRLVDDYDLIDRQHFQIFAVAER